MGHKGGVGGKYKDKAVEKLSLKYKSNGKKDRVKDCNRKNKSRSSRSTKGHDAVLSSQVL